VIKVAGAPCAELLAEATPKYKVASNLNGPEDLGDLYVVVPPGKPLEIEGEAGKDLRAIGTIQILAPGEVLPAGLSARADEQAKKFLSYQRGTYSHGTDTAWAAGDEREVLTFTCPQGEKWLFNRFFGATVANVAGGLKQAQFGIRIYLDDLPFDLIETVMGRKGIDCISCHLPAKEDVNVQPFTLADFPIELMPGRTLKVTCINVSGAAISPTTGASLDVVIHLKGRKEYI